MAETKTPPDLARLVLAVLFLLGLLAASFLVLRSFLLPLSWAALLVIATWPLLMRIERRVGGRRWLAIAALLGGIVALLVLPFVLGVAALVDCAPAIVEWLKQLPERPLPAPPPWVAELPLVGSGLATGWQELTAGGPTGLRARLAPYADEIGLFLAGQLGGIGMLALQSVVTCVLAAVLFSRGEMLAATVRTCAARLGGLAGERAALLAGRAARAVAVGVVVTAMAQAVLGGLGLLLAGVPAPGILTMVMFLAALAQIGAAPVLALATVWLFANGHAGIGVVMIVWTVLVGGIDNFLRPFLIRQGIDLPLVLLFLGVLGGLFAFGVHGLFVGPVVLAVAHTLLAAWLRGADPIGAEVSVPAT